jgi:hypothetical protein
LIDFRVFIYKQRYQTKGTVEAILNRPAQKPGKSSRDAGDKNKAPNLGNDDSIFVKKQKTKKPPGGDNSKA